MFTIETTPGKILAARDYLIHYPEGTTPRGTRRAISTLRKSHSWGDRHFLRQIDSGEHPAHEALLHHASPSWNRALELAAVGALILWIFPLMLHMAHQGLTNPVGV